MTTTLRGMTWNHPRGYDPMKACSRLWAETKGVTVTWDKRSLQDFESYPVEELARRYDLIVIDHPHVGQITGEGCLAPLDVQGREGERDALARGSVGASYPSYNWQGRQWGFPIDAATQVQAWRPDRMATAAATWDDVMALAREGRVLCPMRPPHSLMCLYTLAANLGAPCRVDPGLLIDTVVGTEVYGRLLDFVALIDPSCLSMDPIAVFERMAESRVIAEAFTQAGRPAPLITGSITGDALGYWKAHGDRYNFEGNGVLPGWTAQTLFRAAVMTLQGDGPKLNTLLIPITVVHGADLSQWYKPCMTPDSVSVFPVPPEDPMQATLMDAYFQAPKPVPGWDYAKVPQACAG